jgi:hypothetical protein
LLVDRRYLLLLTLNGGIAMKSLRGFLSIYILAGAALLLLTAPSKAQYQPQLFSHPSSFGKTFYYQPYQIPFRMPPGFNYAYVNPNGGTYNYAPRFQPGGYPAYNYSPLYTNYPPLYVPNVMPYPYVPLSTPSPLWVY